MSVTLGGKAVRRTALVGVPASWAGPMPDLSIQRDLPDLGGYARIPASLLTNDFADLGIAIWGLLRLSFDDRPEVANAQEFGQLLGLEHLSPSAIRQRIGLALKPLLGTWIERRRTSDNQYTYRAIIPSSAQKDRYAKLRRGDLAHLHVVPRSRKTPRITVTHLIDFCRWQLECGRRGWTADSMATISRRWQRSETSVRRSRDRLVETKLLAVDQRSRRLAEIVWLNELYDPHWQIPTSFLVSPTSETESESATSQLSSPPDVSLPARQKPALESATSQTSSPPNSSSPSIRKLTGGSLTEDLSGLGGASATPLTLVEREIDQAEPQAAPSPKSVSAANVHNTAAALISDRRTLASAPAHYRKAMLASIRRAMEAGLDPRHLERALDRVLDEDEIELHCEIVRAAAKQAWADQRAGMCAECAAPGREPHEAGCRQWIRPAQDDDLALVAAAAAASLNEVASRRAKPSSPSSTQAAGQPSDAASTDLLERYLVNRQPPPSDASPDDAATAMTSRIAQLLLAVERTKRFLALATIVRQWRTQLDPSQHPALDTAASVIELALNTEARRAS